MRETDRLVPLLPVFQNGPMGSLLSIRPSGRHPAAVLRSFPFDAIEERFRRWGYVTEKLENRMFFQRCFTSNIEQDAMLSNLRAQGIDPRGKEDRGALFAEFYLSRPASDAAAMSIDQLLGTPEVVQAVA